ncbi:hypothetical protein, partial [Salmonella enterica]|uniref:hypothetical protein n=1 Tax=Salmonella enterica TaxID=28901 RepID=UPI003CEC8F7F
MILTDWHTCPELEPLLQALRGSAGDRILRLSACGCARQVWPLLERESGTRPDLLRAAELAV